MAATALFIAATAVAPNVWTKHILTDYVGRGARCLDGSPGGYYLREGDPSKWIVFHQGGGWCGSASNCLDRANSSLGSSKNWPATYTDRYEGSELFVQPPFDNYTVVYAMYCDGGSWAGNSTDVVGNTTVYYGGAALRAALFEDLIEKRGLLTSTSVPEQEPVTMLYAGCSAGGLTAYLHADWVADLMRTQSAARGRTGGVVVRGFADAMYSLIYDDYAGVPIFPQRMQWLATAMNVRRNINQACVSAYPNNTHWQCMFGSVVLNHITTPMFVLNSKYDTWQLKAILALSDDCKNGPSAPCPSAMVSYWNNYTHQMLAKAAEVPNQHSMFLTNCAAHCQSGTGADWAVRAVNGTTIGGAVTQWWSAGGGTGMRWVAGCDD
eukprot:Hpha_TRINITY_DN1236_c0_g1::TRINITY_DN1236_c0_g1_i1::g.44821::m.44821/K19882/NOTUM; O-palmitoleoyl-L-serine hydrolase